MELNFDVNKFKCAKCQNFVRPKILQCCNGHVFCLKCRLVRIYCSECKFYQNKIDVRNIEMETTMQHSKFPCNFQHRGCNLRLTFNEKYVQQHGDTCTFRSAICCPFDCLWRGSQLQLVPHLIKKHQVHIHNMDKQSKYKLKIKKRDANDERGLQLLALKWHDCLFFLVLTKSRNALIKQESPEQYYTYILRSGPQLCTKFFCRLAIMSHDDQEEMALEWTPRCVFYGMLFAPADNLLNCFPLNRSLDPRKIRVTITDKEKQESVTFTVKLRNKCRLYSN